MRRMIFFFQAEDGIRAFHVTGVQTCALPISSLRRRSFEGAHATGAGSTSRRRAVKMSGVEMLGTAESTARGEPLRAYLEAALDCVIIADVSGCIVEFNPAAERTFGYAREVEQGEKVLELVVPPAVRATPTLAFARFVET